MASLPCGVRAIRSRRIPMKGTLFFVGKRCVTTMTNNCGLGGFSRALTVRSTALCAVGHFTGNHPHSGGATLMCSLSVGFATDTPRAPWLGKSWFFVEESGVTRRGIIHHFGRLGRRKRVCRINSGCPIRNGGTAGTQLRRLSAAGGGCRGVFVRRITRAPGSGR